MVRRLIEQQQMRCVLGHLGKHHPCLLPIRQVAHHLCLHVPGDTIAAQKLAELFPVPVLVGVAEELQRRLGQVQDIDEMLREHTDAQVRVWSHVAGLCVYVNLFVYTYV